MANTSRRKKVESEPISQSIWSIHPDRQRVFWGAVILMLSFFMLVSFGSYLVTGDIDQDIVQKKWAEAAQTEEKDAANIMGVAGAYIAHWFIFEWFGWAAFGWLPIMILAGLFLVGHELPIKIPMSRVAFNTLFYVLFTSCFLGYFFRLFSLPADAIAGGLGIRLNEWLYHIMGFGSLLVWLVLLIAWAIFFHRYEGYKNWFRPAVGLETPAQEPIESVPVPSTPSSFQIEPEDSLELEDLDDPHVPPIKTPEPVWDAAPAPPSIPEPIEPGEVSFTVETAPEPAWADPTETAQQLVETYGEYDPTLDLPQYQYPHLGLLSDYPNAPKSKVSEEELEANKNNIVETMRNFNIGISNIKATIGPTVTLYEIVPEAGVRISKIKGLVENIAMSLAALGIRIIAPMPGKGTIGIEVPNKNRETVTIKSVLGSEKFQKSTFELPIILGKTISNEIFISDLAKMPHLLMAGATGQGKSVGLNVILASLLYKKHPSQVKFVLVDPKKVELTLFNKIERHFLAMLPNAEEAIITDTKKVIHTLNSLCIEMDSRYDLLKDAGVRNIREYNVKFVERRLSPEKGHRFLPYIVLVIDELADLMMTAGKEVEQPIARLAQLARAIGIHLIVATQRPSVNVITGLIKANFPARLSFKVTSKIDSRTILDTGGSEQLVGNGDMLLSMGSDMIRLQGPFVDTPEIDEICEFIGAQRAYDSAYMLPEFYGDDDPDGGGGTLDSSEIDAMFEEAARLLVGSQQGSTSLIQRKLKLGYNRAGRIIDQLERAGIVGPFEGSKAREVLVKDLTHLEEILRSYRK